MSRVGCITQFLCFLSVLLVGVNCNRFEYEPYSLIQENALIAFFPLDHVENISNIAPHFDISQPG